MVHAWLRQVSQHRGSLVLDHPYRPFCSRMLLPVTLGSCFSSPVSSTKVHLWLSLMGITVHQRHLSINYSSSPGAVRTIRNEALHWLLELIHCDVNTKKHVARVCLPLMDVHAMLA